MGLRNPENIYPLTERNITLLLLNLLSYLSTDNLVASVYCFLLTRSVLGYKIRLMGITIETVERMAQQPKEKQGTETRPETRFDKQELKRRVSKPIDWIGYKVAGLINHRWRKRVKQRSSEKSEEVERDVPRQGNLVEQTGVNDGKVVPISVGRQIQAARRKSGHPKW